MAWGDLSGGQKVFILVVSGIAGWALLGGGKEPSAADVAPVAVAPASASCTAMNVSARVNKIRIEDECRTRSCPVFKGTATVTNGCDEPIGVQLKITAVDANGNPLSTRNFWPESTRNMPVGDTVVSLDQTVDPDPQIENVLLSVIQVRRWN